MIKTVLTVAIAACAAAGPALGASLSFSNTDSMTPISQDGMLDLFDTNIGTLNKARLTLFGTGSSSFMLSNASGSNQTVTANSIIRMYFSSSLPGLNTTLDALMPALQLQASTGSVSLAAGTSATFGPLGSSEALTLDALTPSLFAQAGGGNFTLYCENSDEKMLDGGGRHRQPGPHHPGQMRCEGGVRLHAPHLTSPGARLHGAAWPGHGRLARHRPAPQPAGLTAVLRSSVHGRRLFWGRI